MKLIKNRLLRTFICAVLCLSMLSTSISFEAFASPVYNFGTVNTGGLNLRNNVNGKTITQLSLNTVVQILQTLNSPQNHVWYGVYVPDQKVSGFVLASYITAMTPQASTSYAMNNPNSIWNGSQGNVGINNPIGYVRVQSSGTNLRDTPNGNAVVKVDRNTVFPYYSEQSSGGYGWYRIYSQQYGYLYIRKDTVVITNTNGSQPQLPQQNNTVIPNSSGFGTITTILDKINLRQAPKVNAARIGGVGISQTFALLEAPSQNDGYTWYKINLLNKVTGYIRGDCARYNNDGNFGSTIPAPPVAPQVVPPVVQPGNTTDQGIGYGIVTTLPAANLWQAPDGRRIGTINENQSIPVTGAPITRGAYTWYPVNVNLVPGYLRSDSVRYTPGRFVPGVVVPNGQAPIPPAVVPNGTPSKNLITIMDKVNLRVSPTRASRAAYNVPLGTAFPYTRETFVGNSKWYKIAYKATELWVLGSTVRVLSTNESAGLKELGGVQTGDQTGNTPSGYVVTTKGAVNLRQTAGGKTISTIPKKGTVLKHFGTASTRKYTWYKVQANGVTGFLRSDCVALSDSNGGSINNPGTAPNNNAQNIGEFQLVRPVRKSDWLTGEMNRLWPRGTTFTLYDVRTGKTFRARRWAGGKHIDAEPLTAADTAVMCSMYGVQNSNQITSRKHWQARPLWVTINGVTYCCSLYGVPHNLAGNTIKNNNYEGQFCVHFTNSTGHTTGAKPSQNHINAIEEAFRKGQ